MSEYSVERLRAIADGCDSLDFNYNPQARDAIRAYADLREQIERAREGVTDEIVRIAEKAYDVEIDKANADVSAQCGEASRDLSVDYAIRAALQSIAHLLPSGERGGVDAEMVERASAGLYAHLRPDATVAWADLNDYEADKIREEASAALEAALAQPAQAAQVDRVAREDARAYPNRYWIEAINDTYGGKTGEAMRSRVELLIYQRHGTSGAIMNDRELAAVRDAAEPVAQGEAVLRRPIGTQLELIAHCPFCGSEAGLRSAPNDYATSGGEVGLPHVDSFFVHCDGCGCDGPVGDSEPNARDLWNDRAAQPASPEQPAGRQGEVLAVAPFIVGNAYRTQDGELVRFVSVHNEGTSYETMEDEAGVHRYTRRDFGRVTGTAHDYSDPRNTPPLYTHPAAPVGVPNGPTNEDIDRACRFIFGDATDMDAKALANALSDYHRRMLAAVPPSNSPTTGAIGENGK